MNAVIEQKKTNTRKHIGDGIYRDPRNGSLFERPVINGKRTWIKLDVHNKTLALKLQQTKRSQHVLAKAGVADVRDPYAAPAATVGELVEAYVKAGCPMENFHARVGKPLAAELRHLQFDEAQLEKLQKAGKCTVKPLVAFWGHRLADQIRKEDCALYFAKRKSEVRANCTGGRIVDMELTVLANVLNWAVGLGKLKENLVATRPTFRSKEVKHCREAMPNDINELSRIVTYFFDDYKSEVIGWQALMEAMTGCRTNEVLRMRWDAKNEQESGFIQGDWLWVARSKKGVNPYVIIHPALRELLQVLRQWHNWRKPSSPWFFPSCHNDGEQPVSIGTLTDSLGRIAQSVVGHHLTSHGLRAFYVTVRRSMGIQDAQIAAEIGDRSGASIITSTYGAIPPNWSGGPGLTFDMVAKPWSVLAMPENVVSLPQLAVA